jgi:L,D-peptidoglycan transpeptidase YkuD (ErfK/YbiS/YcfS/YnhG family)
MKPIGQSLLVGGLIACVFASSGGFSTSRASAGAAVRDHAGATSLSTRAQASGIGVTPDGNKTAKDQSSTTTTTSIAAASTSTSTTVLACHQDLASHIAIPADVGQLITVEVSRSQAVDGTLIAWQRQGSCWSIAHGPFQAVIAYRGINAHKREGDDTTPAGMFGFGSTIFGTAPNPGVKFIYHRLVCGDWWDEDSLSRDYNLFVHVACGTEPLFNNGSSEALWTETLSYRSFAVINYNKARTPGRGSAIFLHAFDGAPTTGCVSTPLVDLDAILDWMNPAKNPRIDIGTPSTITRY